MKQIRNILPLAILTAVGCFFLLSGTSSAATLNVTTNDVSPAANADGCTLREAIQNINDQAQTNADCAAGDGSTDTIIIPSGNIVLAADLPQITTSITIQGAGMGSTVIDGNMGQYGVFWSLPAATDTFTVTGITIRAYHFFALLSLQGNLSISQLEIDGRGASFDTGPGSFSGAIAVQNPTASSITVDMTDVYVHDITSDSQTMFAIIVMGGGNTAPAEDITFRATNVTVARLANTGAIIGIGAGFGILNGGAGAGDTTATLQNVTVTGLASSNDSSVGVAAMTLALDKNTVLTVNNATIGNISGSSTNFLRGSALAAVSAGGQPGVGSRSSVTVSNTLIFSSPLGCGLGDLSAITGGNPGVNTITSQGGNLSDDASCASYFTQTTDQNNVSGLAASLSALADNGGYVPTMALKQGSPAIDAGITVAGLTTDARLAARPQGTAYDSGAYESPYSKPVATATLASSGENVFISLVGALAIIPVLVLTRKRLGYSVR